MTSHIPSKKLEPNEEEEEDPEDGPLEQIEEEEGTRESLFKKGRRESGGLSQLQNSFHTN